MSFLQLWGLRLLIVLIACGITWGAADVHYSKQITALKVAHTQELKDQQAQDAATLSRYAATSLEVNDEAQKQIASMSSDIADLRVRNDDAHAALQLCTSDPVRQPVPVADGSGAAASPGPDAAAPGSSEPTVAVPLDEYKDQLKIGIQAIDAELLMRRILREGGQAN
jgi:hypothetical protein